MGEEEGEVGEEEGEKSHWSALTLVGIVVVLVALVVVLSQLGGTLDIIKRLGHNMANALNSIISGQPALKG